MRANDSLLQSYDSMDRNNVINLVQMDRQQIQCLEGQVLLAGLRKSLSREI
jgi:hypothetical protein